MLVGITIVFSVLYVKLPDVKVWAIAQYKVAESKEQQNMSTLPVEDAVLANVHSHMQLRVNLPEGVTGEEIQVHSNYMTQTFRIEVPHKEDNYFEKNPITGRSDHIEDLSYVQGKRMDVIAITLDQVYEINTGYDTDYYYIDFVEPKELYEYVVVIDAGHGGKDGGAEEYGILEKDIDLAIVLALKEFFDMSEKNIKVYYTRMEDINPTYESRVGLANKSKADLFISVHNNSYDLSSEIKGTEVMYSESHEGEFTSQRLAEICMEELTGALGSSDRGILEGDSIYIINNSEVPVALLEIGFMTNAEELKLLNTPEYQKKTAEAIYNAVLKALEEISETE